MASEDTDMVTGPSGEGSSAGGSSSAASKRPKRFEIKKWNAVALWAWGMYLLFFFSLLDSMGVREEGFWFCAFKNSYRFFLPRDSTWGINFGRLMKERPREGGIERKIHKRAKDKEILAFHGRFADSDFIDKKCCLLETMRTKEEKKERKTCCLTMYALRWLWTCNHLQGSGHED